MTDVIRFYNTRDAYGCFSNFARYPIRFDTGPEWPTTEHFYQAMKTENENGRETIRNLATPKLAAEYGRTKITLRPNWDMLKDNYMFLAVMRKMILHPHPHHLLMTSGDCLIVEDSPYDWYWGCGRDGKGRNRLGEILMEVREEIRKGRFF